MIVASCCRPRGLASLLNALARQEGIAPGQVECVVAWYGESPDERDQYRRILKDSRVCRSAVELHRPDGPGAFRNHAAARAAGELFFCIDDDCVPDPHCLQECLQFSGEHPELAAWGGMTRTGNPQAGVSWPERIAAWLEPTWQKPQCDPAGRVWFIPGLHFLVRRSAFLRGGGFPAPFFMIGEDSALCLALHRCALPLGFNPRQQVRHQPPRSLAGLARRTLEYGRVNARLRQAYPDVYPQWSARGSIRRYQQASGPGMLPALTWWVRTFLYHSGQVLESLRRA